MKKILVMFFMVLWCISAEKSDQINPYNKFQKYPIKVYKRELKIPPTYRYDELINGYRDENNLYINSDLKIDFADRYSVILRSCGTECRFYSLLDLSTGGEDFEIFEEFNTFPDEESSMNQAIAINELRTQIGNSLLINYQTTRRWSDNEYVTICRQKQYLLKTSQDGKNILKQFQIMSLVKMTRYMLGKSQSQITSLT